jgi:hypothetical protein
MANLLTTFAKLLNEAQTPSGRRQRFGAAAPRRGIVARAALFRLFGRERFKQFASKPGGSKTHAEKDL